MRALDLFCGAGGASMGMHRAGFEVTGVDLAPQPRYPFRFIQADALRHPLYGYDLIWASPPCQAYSITRAIHGRTYPDLVPCLRERLEASGLPFVIENVPGAPLRSPIMLCGTMFGLGVIRHRHFETSFPVLAPSCGPHGPTGSHRGYSAGFPYVTVGGHNYRLTEGARAMRIDWMSKSELSQAIPPDYAQFLAHAFLNQKAAA